MERREFVFAGAIAALALYLTFFFGAFTAPKVVEAAKPEKYRIAWSRYVGWEPWGYMEKAGILKKWAQKYGIEIELVFFTDYVESINQYTGGQFHGVTVTNMDTLTMPAVGGVDSTAIVVGDFSNGNDGVVLKNGNTVRDLKGRKVKIVEGSVSHYLLARALDKEGRGLTEKDLTLVHTSDAQIQDVFLNDSDPRAAVVTWNPMLMEVRTAKNAKMVFDSSQIPGEIIDMLVVKTDAPEKLKKALAGAWYETMAVMSANDKTATAAVEFMAKNSGATLAQFKAQLKTTAMFYKAADAVAFTKSKQLKDTMEYVRTFSFDHGLYGDGKKSKDFVGIQFPDKSVMGDAKNVKFRFDSTYMQLAAEGKL